MSLRSLTLGEDKTRQNEREATIDHAASFVSARMEQLKLMDEYGILVRTVKGEHGLEKHYWPFPLDAGGNDEDAAIDYALRSEGYLRPGEHARRIPKPNELHMETARPVAVYVEAVPASRGGRRRVVSRRCRHSRRSYRFRSRARRRRVRSVHSRVRSFVRARLRRRRRSRTRTRRAR